MIDATSYPKISIVKYAAATAANTNSVVDIRGYQGLVGIVVNAGAATAGTNPTLDIYLQSTSESNGANAVNINVSATQVTTASSLQVLAVDPRAVANRYLVVRQIIGGTSSPSFPLGITMSGIPNAIA